MKHQNQSGEQTKLESHKQKEELKTGKNDDSKSIAAGASINLIPEKQSITYICILIIAILLICISRAINSFGRIISNEYEDENYGKIEAKLYKQDKSKDQRVSTLTQTLTNWFNKCICIID